MIAATFTAVEGRSCWREGVRSRRRRRRENKLLPVRSNPTNETLAASRSEGTQIKQIGLHRSNISSLLVLSLGAQQPPPVVSSTVVLNSAPPRPVNTPSPHAASFPAGAAVTNINSSLSLGYGIQGDVGVPGDPGQPMINGVVEFVGFPKGDKGTQVCLGTQTALVGRYESL